MTFTDDALDVRPETPDPEIHITRSKIDRLLVAFGVVVTVALLAVGGLLLWGANFADDYVHRELSSQNITFPTADELREEGRDDLLPYAGEDLTTGSQAEAYASYINGHLQETADGLTYSDIDDRGAAQAVTTAQTAGAPAAEIAELQVTAATLKAQRDTLFKGETLRGLLLTSYAWSTVGMIAGIVAWVVIAAAVIMGGLTIAGAVHLRRQRV